VAAADIEQTVEVGIERVFLRGPLPNPSYGLVQLVFGLPRRGKVKINVYDAAGRKIKTLVEQNYEAGIHLIRWKGTSQQGKRVAPGVYFMTINLDGKLYRKEVVLIK
jgi:flagellar hook assembly protein FlgD